MDRAWMPYLLMAAVVACGVAVYAGVASVLHLLPLALWGAAPVAAFALLYLAVARLPGSARPPEEAWRARDLRLLLPGTVVGAALQVLPVVATAPASSLRRWDGQAFAEFLGPMGFAFTLLAVTWEELWFRNPVLDRVTGPRARLAFALYAGTLFAAVHFFNPAFDPLRQGPALVLAGAFLTMSYWAAGSIWLPLGLHFGFNLAGGALRAALDPFAHAAVDSAAASHVRAALLAVAIAMLFVRARGRAAAADAAGD